jgi:nicotinate-nucleotide adenylyltransferase
MNNRFIVPGSGMSNPKRVHDDSEKTATVSPLAVYFGTFNPVHYGHLQIAQAVLHQGYAQQVAFVPTGNPPNRIDDPSLLDGHHRFEMLKRATAQYSHFTVWPDEIDFPNQSQDHSKTVHYTCDTLEKRFHLSKREDSLQLPFILGEDTFNTLSRWKNIDLLCFHCHFLVIRRHSQGPSSPLSHPLSECRYTLLNLPFLPYSATEIRQIFSAGQSPLFLTPDVVIEYSQWNQLY